MAGLGWLTRALAEVPLDDAWLGAHERAVLATLRTPKRRAEWRLGRWAAKAALAAWAGAAASEIEILAAEDGAPEALAGGAPMPVSFSLSHRAGRALAVVCRGGRALGCDLEVVERRSPAFVRQWLTPAERQILEASPAEWRDLVANLLWTAKEAALKARREGLRVDVRDVRVELRAVPAAPGRWKALQVRCEDRPPMRGWWRHEARWVMSVVSDPAPSRPPQELRG